jgi:CO/xanthine dehydrogenase FAD-binding subunit
LSNLAYYKPASLDDVWEIKTRISEALFIGGGTDLMVKIRQHVVKPPALISLRTIPELRGITAGSHARIGAMTTISELILHPELGRHYPVLIEAAGRLGSMQIRNVATIGGNLGNCSPCADTALPLLVLDAKVRLQGPDGSRELPIQEFFLGPGKSCLGGDEILTDILLPAPLATAQTAFFKKGRVRMDLAIASVAALFEMDGKTCRQARLAAGSVGPVPMRLPEVEALLEQNPPNDDIIIEAGRLAANSVAPITDIRSTEDYRRQIISVFVKRAAQKIRAGDST